MIKQVFIVSTCLALTGCAGGNAYLRGGSYVQHYRLGDKFIQAWDNRAIGVGASTKLPEKGGMVYSADLTHQRNSIGKPSTSAVAAARYMQAVGDIVHVGGGVFAGAATGYKSITGTDVVPVAGVVASVEDSHPEKRTGLARLLPTGLDVIAVPSIDKVIGFIASTFKWRVATW